MIKLVLFDLDGTLLNRTSSLIKFIENQYDRLHTNLSNIPKQEYVDRFLKFDCRGYV
ncbi:HAD hydrolase-like protein [Bacillus sp. AFS002410]|uniref:HAD hydrolase-like protein n=1 Tax=Bacillus sp. AFS002410 TaxID=2033481 RepID=UPI00211D7AA0|nr:HAD hydrolase-like protein [Bacillus sp. AFS002410]